MNPSPATPEPEEAASSGVSWDNLSRLGRLVRKELFEILRDRRTILTLVLMPVLLYPLLSIAFQQFFLASRLDPTRGPEYQLGFASEAERDWFVRHLGFGGKHLQEGRKPGKGSPQVKLFVIKKGESLENLVQAGVIDLAIYIKSLDKLPAAQDKIVDYEAIFLPDAPGSQGALLFVERRLAAANAAFLKERLDVPAATKVVLGRLHLQPLQVAGAAGFVSLSALVPLILILMTITGAVYPAIDLTAGERERGTLEILVAAPVPRLGLLFAKYVTVVTVAILTAIINLVSMVLTLVLSQLGPVLFQNAGLTPLLVVQLFGLLILFAMFFSAVLLSLTSFARSFKEAQAYLIPLMLASLAPGLAGMIPGLKLEGLLTVTPLINIVLLARDLLDGNADPGTALLVVLSTLLYALAAISLAARVFGAESVLYSEQSGWSDLWRRPDAARPYASMTSALGCLAVMIPCHFLVQGLMQFLGPPSLPGYLVFLAVLTLGLFAGIPLGAAYLGRVRLTTGFALRPARPAAYAAGILLGLCLWPLVLQLLVWVKPDIPEWQREHYEAMIQTFRLARQNLLGGLVASMVVVGLAEEFFFRGFLLSALLQQTRAWAALALSAILFGLMHVLVSSGGLAFERLLPSMLLGGVLSWVCWRTGSVLPGMLLHGTHNAILMLIGQSELMGPSEVPTPWLAAGATGSLLGFLLLAWTGRTARPR